MTATANLPPRPRRGEVWMMPTADGEKPHLVVSNNRMNEAVSYPFVHVIWMGTNLTRVRFAEQVVLGAADRPLVGFVDCTTLRRASKTQLIRRFGVLPSATMERVEEGHPGRPRVPVMNLREGVAMGPQEAEEGLEEFPPASVEDYNEMGLRISAEEIAAVEAEGLAFQPPED